MCACTALLLVFIAMFFLGRFSAQLLKRSFMARKSRLIYLFDLTASDMARIQRLLADPNPLIRSAGYYGLLDSGTAGADYLLEQYGKETDRSVRLVILYVLYTSGHTETVMDVRRDAPEYVRDYIDTVLLRKSDRDRDKINSRIVL
ncbi:MAG: hypothetical protein ACOC2H_03470 [Spirochaetota bacterium]